MQMTLFDMTREEYSINKPIRLIELFAGYGSQAMALRNLGVKFKHHRVVEFDKYAIASYNAVHGTDFTTTDIQNVGGGQLGIEETDKYTYIMTYSFPCLTEDMMVLTSFGFKKIKDVIAGDLVLTHQNRYKPVVRSMCTGEKETYRIKGMCFHEIRCTSNHKFYVRRMVRHYPQLGNGKRGNIRKFLKPEWKQCSELDKSYYMGVAINKNEIIPEWHGVKFGWADGRKARIKNELSEKMNNPDFWWLIGRYVGDGWHRSQGGIIICADRKETAEITTVADKLKISYSISKERTVDKIHFPSKEIELFVNPFGRGAENKTIPGFVIDLPKELVKAFVDGYVSADGTFTQGRYKTSSVSKELSYGIAQCVAKAYEAPFSIYKNHRKKKTVIENRIVNQKDAYQVVWKTEKRKQDKAFFEDGYIWFPIQEIVPTGETENVYDLEVADDHSFTVNGTITHNCTDISIAGRMQGFEQGSGTRSSLLWEVQRILEELNEVNSLPQVLLMENVTAIHSEENKPHFQKWLDFLEEMGYSNFIQDLNASDYGIAQNRDRTFVVSILGNWNYHFPKPIELTTCIEDYFEDLTDEQALQLVVKSEKAMNLLVELDEDGKLE